MKTIILKPYILGVNSKEIIGVIKGNKLTFKPQAASKKEVDTAETRASKQPKLYRRNSACMIFPISDKKLNKNKIFVMKLK